MVKEIVFGAAGGLGLFLFGMGLLSDGLKRVAGQKLRKLLGSLTKNRIIAVFLGVLTTGIIQSSSATTVMTVGFVNAGLLTLGQALGVILGANIGTTVTAWLVSILGIAGLKITAFIMPAIGAGFLLQVATKTEKTRSTGSVLLGFGLLFLGISIMKDAFGPLQNSTRVQSALIWLGQKPALGLLAGIAMTTLLQSSSATIMMLQVMAFQGAFGTDWDIVLRVTIPIILGDNIGTTITAQLASLRTSRNAKRAAMGHTVFNCIGVAYILPLTWAGWYPNWVEWITPLRLSQSTIMAHMAVAHTAFNVVNVLVFLPFISWLEAVVIRMLPVREDELTLAPAVLERHLLSTPVIALDQTKREIVRMCVAAEKAVQQSVEGLMEADRAKLTKAMELETVTDEFQHEITDYLVALSKRELSDELSVELPVLLHTVNDLERVGDHAVNIAEIGLRKIAQNLPFSDFALSEAAQLRQETDQMFDYIIAAMENSDAKAARSALVNEANLNRMQLDFRRNHVQRMTEGLCSPETGLIFIDLVDNMEKIGDHLTNIAQSVIGGLQWDGMVPKAYPVST